MKAKELAEKLLENPEFEVKAIRLYPSIGWGLTMEKYSVNGLADVGYSDGVVVLDLEREEDQQQIKLTISGKTEVDIMCDTKKIESLINASKQQKAYLQSALMYSPICWKDGRLKFDRQPCGKDCYTCMYDTFGELVQ